ncbi:MAG: hypothetical protein ABSF22_11285 [Bryobacteraceae bacterium]
MSKVFAAAGLLISLCAMAMAQTPDPRIDQLTKENAQLKRKIADQEERIAELEKAVKTLQAAAAPLPAPIPGNTPPWHQAANWNQIKSGMSESQVVGILGPATSVDTSIDKRILLYTPDPHSTSTLNGSVTLVDDRVAAMTPPAFSAHP